MPGDPAAKLPECPQRHFNAGQRTRLFSIGALFFFSLGFRLGTLPAQRVADNNATYQQLRGLLPGGEVITVKDFELKRDAATFTFSSGRFAFYGQVNGKVTGAVF